MFKKMVPGVFLISMAFGITAFSSPALACPDTQDWDCFHTSAGSSTSVSNQQFSGSGTLSHWYTGTIACDDVVAIWDGFIWSGDLYIAVTGFDTSNSSNTDCADLSFSNFNWNEMLSAPSWPTSETDIVAVMLTLSTPTISYLGTQVCQDDVHLTYANDGAGGSSVDIDTSISGWAGSCSLDATMYNSTVSVH